MISLLLTAALALHPLGNFSINQLVELELHPDSVSATAIVDLAELPTLAEQPISCPDFASHLALTQSSTYLHWTVISADLTRSPGVAGLDTTRLVCHLTAPATLTSPGTLSLTNSYLPDRVGWREITASASGVALHTSLPAHSSTDQLRTYPSDVLSSPLDIRQATLSYSPGSAAAAPAATSPLPTTNFLARAESLMQRIAGQDHLTPLVGTLAVLLALLLGAAHAALPGHGKTVMAVYLAGKRGRRRDALTVGATVTATHTGGVLIIGLLLTSISGLAGEKVLGWLGIASGTLVTAVGAAMLTSDLRHRLAPSHPLSRLLLRLRSHLARNPHSHGHHLSHGHSHDPSHGHHHSHDHPHDTPHGHRHGQGHVQHGHSPVHTHHGEDAGHHGHSPHDHSLDHDHEHADGHQRGHRASLTALGVAGGLVPSPSALVVLLGAIALGRTGFGVLLVLAYGLGMAATLTVAGLLLITVRDRWKWKIRLPKLAPGVLVLVVGLGLAVRAVALV